MINLRERFEADIQRDYQVLLRTQAQAQITGVPSVLSSWLPHRVGRAVKRVFKSLLNYLMDNAYKSPKLVGMLVTLSASALNFGILSVTDTATIALTSSILTAIAVTLTVIIVGHLAVNRSVRNHRGNSEYFKRKERVRN